MRVPGFRFAGVRAGLKGRGRDVALIVSDWPAVAAAMVTTNHAAAAPVRITRARVRDGRLRAVLVHSGNANACTGRQGRMTEEVATTLVGRLLGADPRDVAPCATGRIGVQVPRARLLSGVRAAVGALHPGGLPDAAEAITTTDVFPKTAVRRIRVGGRRVTVAALGKGAGMIAPNMATLLVFVVTDASIGASLARRVLGAAVGPTLNAITVDGDMSTNDTVLLLASGAAGNGRVRVGTADARRLTTAVTDVLGEIARLVLLDGEGASRLVEVRVGGARTPREAARVARAVAESTLCKAAFHGADPNWGRFVCAAGTAGVPLDAERVSVRIGGRIVSRRGRPVAGALGPARRRMQRREIEIALDLGRGTATSRMYTTDLSVEYVRFNAEYTT